MSAEEAGIRRTAAALRSTGSRRESGQRRRAGRQPWAGPAACACSRRAFFSSGVRVGTLDHPDLLPPDIHIYTSTKQPWVIIPDGTPAVPAYYERETYWPVESLDRRRAIEDRIAAHLASRVKMS